MSKDMISVIDKKYIWPDVEMVNGSGDCTRPSKLIALSISQLGEVIHDFAKITEQRQDNHYGLYQLCPKCDGWGEVQLPETSKPMFGTCPVCNGQKLLVRPEINLPGKGVH